MVPFWGVFLDQGSLLFIYPFEYIYFFWALTQLKSQFILDGGEFLKPDLMYPIMPRSFPIR